MNKNIIITLVIILFVAVGGTVYYLWLQESDEEITSFIVPNVLEPYVKIEKNEELSSSEFILNGENTEMYYYFELYNYDKDLDVHSTLAITPYVKIGIRTNNAQQVEENNDSNYVNINLYYIKDLSLGLVEGNFEEITKRGDEGSGYEEYFECKRLEKYSEGKEEINVNHYLAKVKLNTEDENYNNLKENVNQKLEIILGYRK